LHDARLAASFSVGAPCLRELTKECLAQSGELGSFRLQGREEAAAKWHHTLWEHKAIFPSLFSDGVPESRPPFSHPLTRTGASTIRVKFQMATGKVPKLVDLWAFCTLILAAVLAQFCKVFSAF
jgi:hypothetical protein